MKIAADLLGQIVAHALELPREEVCGVVAVRPLDPDDVDGEKLATRVHRAENVHASALKFEIAPMELYALNEAIEDEGAEIGAIYHSHVRSEPYPSQTDIGFAAGWPGLEWIIVGLASGEQPNVRSYVIDGADVREVALQEPSS
ncbi:MAG TPA: M67 family metallopeptidase [Solirubrobacteraceae bacterium]|jgi:proteasome lid subunit RPN8/RPN11|nr:M67 family metallopeptidase [Solirubrobacteraceae bacterium]